jgi:hypothetical protein|tara:strand:+ start:4274 stop:4579 length:306 start_codon:yes stop_codon:yes gene_type:complete
MEKMQKFIVDSDTDSCFFITEDPDFLKVPFFCPVCDFIMSNIEDSKFYNEFGCCSSCSMKFAQSRRAEWKLGWRPSKKEINDHKKFIESQPLNLFLDDDHN